jgi:predicted PurR-regulated permease PerM
MESSRQGAAEPPAAGPAGPVRRTLVGLGLAATTVVVLLGVREVAWLLAPLLLSVLIVTLVHPVHTWLAARGWPAAVSVGGLLLAVYGAVGLVAAMIVYALARFAALLTEHVASLQDVTDRIAAQLAEAGINAPQVRELLEWIDVPATARWLTGQIPSIVGMGTMVVFVGTVLVFLGIESTQLPLRTRALRRDHPDMYAALALCASRTRRFFGVTTVFAIIVGALNTVLLYALDVPMAPLWGLLAAVCNYIPYLGFWIGLVPPAVLALALDGWETMLVVVIAYLVLNFVVTSLLAAQYIGDAVGLSIAVEVVAVVLWAWLLGPLGALLAVPLTILAKALLVDTNPSAEWLSGFLGSAKSLRQAPPPGSGS